MNMKKFIWSYFMVFDITEELRDFTYITSVYKCISNYNLRGHQIGRKIGDMLEILTMGAVYRNPELKNRLKVENKLEGYTTAGHKVEFGFFNEDKLFGAIECKCVGVEETTDGKGTKCLRKLTEETAFDIEFSSRWLKSVITMSVQLKKIKSDRVLLYIYKNRTKFAEMEIKTTQNFKICVDENSQVYISKPEDDMLSVVPGVVRICKNIYLKSLSTSEATFELRSCLTGPQTIEKAKQASLVAMDLRKKIDGHWGKEEIIATPRKMTFVHVLCEYSHWEEKSLNVIKTCIDHNIMVPDAVIIKAFEVFEEKFSAESMLDKIAKNIFEEDENVRNAVYEVMDFFEGKIFYDIELKKYVKFDYRNEGLVVLPE